MGEWVDLCSGDVATQPPLYTTVMLLITPLLPAPSGGLNPQLAGKSSTGGIVSYTRVPL